MTGRVGHRSVETHLSPPVAKVRSFGTADSITVFGTLNGKATPFVLDSGANRSLVRSDLFPTASLPRVLGGLADVTGSRSSLYGPTTVTLEIGGITIPQTVYVADALSDGVILGLDFLRQHHCVLDLDKGIIHVDNVSLPLQCESPGGDRSPPSALRVRVMEPVIVASGSERLVRCKTVGQNFQSLGIVEARINRRSGLMVGRAIVYPHARSIYVPVANLTDSPVRVRAGSCIGTCEQVDVGPGSPGDGEEEPVGPMLARRTGIGSLPAHLAEMLEASSRDLSPDQRDEVRTLLTTYADVFSAHDQDLGRTSVIEHHIETGDACPVKVPPRRIPIHKRQEVEDTVRQLSEQGLIEPSFSPWSSALVLVRKKDGSLRCCVDYRLLNAATIKDSYPLPRIDDTLDALSGSRWFSTLDLKSGYHQVALAEADKSKTAFSAGNGLWQWRVMPFGLSNAPATFERLMESILAGMHWRTLLVYLDDIIVFGKTFEEELQRLEEVFRRMRCANLKLNPNKCLLFRSEVPFLGHVVSRDGVKTDPSKTEAVADWPVPTNAQELRSFLGFCTYYRRFVRGFSDTAAPLNALTKKGVAFGWDQACQASFDKLKAALAHAPVLQYPDPIQPFILDTDASSQGIGAVLSQIHDGVERVVAYFSRTLSAPERNYCVTRRELLAVVDAVRHFHSYLYGSKFTIRSDHSALQWLHNLRDPEGQLARWLARLGQYDFHITHRAGDRHTNADALSRRPCSSDCHYCAKRESLRSVCRATKIASVSPAAGELDIRSAQGTDPEIAPLLSFLQQGSRKPDWEQVSADSRVTKLYWAQWEQLRMSNGILQRRWESTNGTEGKWLNVIPQSLRDSILAEAHGSVSSGHMGVKKTLQRLRKRSYWVGMRRDVQEWCRVCHVCAAKKGPQRTPQAPLQVVGVGVPMQRVAVDVAGPFPVSSAGNRYIVVVIDYFTKWPEAFPVPNQEAATVAQVLVDGFFCRFGLPDELHSDQGRNFESALFQECCRLLGIRKTRTTPLHPESDGMVERFNRTLVQEMAKRCRHGQSDWDQHIPTILMAYRSAEHEATGYTPAQLMLGRDLRLPLDLLFEGPPDDPVDQLTTEYARSQRDRMRVIRAQVADNVRLSAETMKQRKDIRATLEPLKENDQVWLYNPRRKKGHSPKLSSPWDGPYRVVKSLSAVTYRIQKNRQAACKVVHFNRLWKIGGPPEFTWSSIPSPESATGRGDDAGVVPTSDDVTAMGDTRGDAGVIPASDTVAAEHVLGREIGAVAMEHPRRQPGPDESPPGAGDRSPAQNRSQRPQRQRRRPEYLRSYNCH